MAKSKHLNVDFGIDFKYCVMLDNVPSIRTDVYAIWLKRGGRVVPGAKYTIIQNQMWYSKKEHSVTGRGNKVYRIPDWQMGKKRDGRSIQTVEIKLKL